MDGERGNRSGLPQLFDSFGSGQLGPDGHLFPVRDGKEQMPEW